MAQMGGGGMGHDGLVQYNTLSYVHQADFSEALPSLKL